MFDFIFPVVRFLLTAVATNPLLQVRVRWLKGQFHPLRVNYYEIYNSWRLSFRNSNGLRNLFDLWLLLVTGTLGMT